MHRIFLELDEQDFRHIQQAIALRQSFRVMPEYKSNVAGAVVAEICRGWLEFHGQDLLKARDDGFE